MVSEFHIHMNKWIKKWMNIWDYQIPDGTIPHSSPPINFCILSKTKFTLEENLVVVFHAIKKHRILDLEGTLVVLLVRVNNSSKYNNHKITVAEHNKSLLFANTKSSWVFRWFSVIVALPSPSDLSEPSAEYFLFI